MSKFVLVFEVLYFKSRRSSGSRHKGIPAEGLVVYHPDLLVPVGFSSVCDSHHENDKRICEHFVDNPVIPHA